MPAPLVKHLADRSGKSKQRVEHLWDRAKAIAKRQGKSGNYAYITGITKKMLSLSGFSEAAIAEALEHIAKLENYGMVTAAEEPIPVDKPDEICLDVPLLIRLLEWAREDVKDDVDLHVATEKMASIHHGGKACLTMDDYEHIVSMNKRKETSASSRLASLFTIQAADDPFHGHGLHRKAEEHGLKKVEEPDALRGTILKARHTYRGKDDGASNFHALKTHLEKNHWQGTHKEDKDEGIHTSTYSHPKHPKHTVVLKHTKGNARTEMRLSEKN